MCLPERIALCLCRASQRALHEPFAPESLGRLLKCRCMGPLTRDALKEAPRSAVLQVTLGILMLETHCCQQPNSAKFKTRIFRTLFRWTADFSLTSSQFQAPGMGEYQTLQAF